MKILQIHNYYQLAGGEDTVVAIEKKLLEEKGHKVFTYYRHNDELADYSVFQKARLLKDSTWSKTSYDDVIEVLRENKPDVCHVHNFLPLISPSVYAACKSEDVPVVQTLHNYRLICANGLLFRNGKVCEDCVGKSAYNAVAKKCYRNSTLQTYAVARMIESNKANNIWSDLVDSYLCFTEFAKDKFIAGGLPENKIHLKPNFVDFSWNASVVKEDYIIYVGRLEANKGVRIFQEISTELEIPLKIVGEGELYSELDDMPNVELLGKRSYDETIDLIRRAKALVLPSLWYEGMPMTILEAFANKTVVIASEMGAMETMIEHNKNGLLFEPNSSEELKKCIEIVVENETDKLISNAFSDYKNLYSKNANYNALMKVYENVIK